MPNSSPNPSESAQPAGDREPALSPHAAEQLAARCRQRTWLRLSGPSQTPPEAGALSTDDTVADRPATLHHNAYMVALEAAVRRFLRLELANADLVEIGRFGLDGSGQTARKELSARLATRLFEPEEIKRADVRRAFGPAVAAAVRARFRAWATGSSHPDQVNDHSTVPSMPDRDEWIRLDAWLEGVWDTDPKCALAVALRAYAGLARIDIATVTGLNLDTVTRCLRDAGGLTSPTSSR